MQGLSAKPFLRWAGSKRKLLPRLIELAPEKFTRYVEPFAGSACLFFALQPKSALLGDINRELIRTYLEVKHRVEEVIADSDRLNCSENDYYRIRAWRPELLPGSTRAARFIYLNRFCFNGIYRTNRAGQFNVPFGADRAGPLPSPETLRACSLQLKAASLKDGRFEKVLAAVREGDFVYLDPPFSVRSRRVFKEYGPQLFSEEDLCLLKAGMVSMDKRGIHFLVSYADSEEGDYLRRGFSYAEVEVRRHIAGFARDRQDSRELLIYNA